MKSTRNVLALDVISPADGLSAFCIKNHICLSSEYPVTGLNHVVKLKLNKSSESYHFLRDTITYPVSFIPEFPRNKVLIPEEIRQYYSFDPGHKLSCTVEEIKDSQWVDIRQINFAIQKIHGSRTGMINIAHEELIEAVKVSLLLVHNNYPLQNGQIVLVPCHGVTVELCVKKIVTEMQASQNQSFAAARLAEFTSINFINDLPQQVELVTSLSISQNNVMTEIPVSFVDKGIGGHKDAIARLIRTVFFTRAMTPAWLKAYGITQHSKGAILYGPPGTGKTLIAKIIGELFTKEAVRIIEGPELKNKFYGESQQNLADLFIDARSNPDKTFVYLFDEIDALFPVRGSDGGTTTSVNNDLVSRMLSIMDGLKSLNNVIVFGTTNRIELMDPAILRAGRLETHIYIGLPNEADREEILHVLTRDMSQTLHQDVNLKEIAYRTKNYAGADLARLIRVASTYVMAGNFIEQNGMLTLRPDLKSLEQVEKITQRHFLQALNEVKSTFAEDDVRAESNSQDFVVYQQSIQDLLSEFSESLACLQQCRDMNQLNILIHGQAGTGKSSAALHLAQLSQFPHIQILNPAKLLNVAPGKRLEYIDDFFYRAQQSTESGVIILDNIENLIESSADYSSYNNLLRLKLNEVLKSGGKDGRKLLVIATTENLEFMQRAGLCDHFPEISTLVPIRLDESNLLSLGARLGIKTVNTEGWADTGQVIDIAIKDLLYQLRKFLSRHDNPSQLVMRDFIQAIPARYKLPHLAVIMPQNKISGAKSNFFTP